MRIAVLMLAACTAQNAPVRDLDGGTLVPCGDGGLCDAVCLNPIIAGTCNTHGIVCSATDIAGIDGCCLADGSGDVRFVMCDGPIH